MRMALSLLNLGAIAVGALVSTGCTESVPPPPQGAISYRFWRAGGQGCIVGGHAFSAPDTGRGQNVTSTGVGQVAVDGENGAKVSCRVSGDGATFSVTGELMLGDISFSIDTQVSPGDKEADGKVRLQDNITASTFAQPAPLVEPPTAPCKVDISRGNFGVGSGWVWGHFICDNIVDERNPGAFCSAEGTFIFENCDE